MSESVLVWDHAGEPPTTSDNILWRRYDRHDVISSVPQYLEDHADRLRAKYLAFIHELGETLIMGKRIIDHLDKGDGFSLWWMTRLAEKSPFKSPRIYDCLRLLALEEILTASRPTELTLVSCDAALGKAIRRLCENLGILFRMQSMRTFGRRKNLLRRMYDALPSSVQSLLSMRHVVAQWPLRKSKRSKWFSHENTTFICSYFIHLDPVSCACGEFHSRQWEGLPKMLTERGRFTNWIQLFMFSSAVPDLATGIFWLDNFNQDTESQGVHRFLQSYLSGRRLLRVLRSWIWLSIVGWRLRDIQSAFNVRGSHVWLWPILRVDWQLSLNGPVGLGNCLWIELFDAALSEMPHQKTGLYLCENQAWEKALLRAWRKHGHGQIIGVQHSTVPFWHLYCFDDKRSLARKHHCALPLPDQMAVNGAAAARAFAQVDYPMDRIVEVEALRYLNISPAGAKIDLHTRRQAAARPPGTVKVIVLGDINAASMDHLMGVLNRAAMLLPAGFEFTVKPHPGYHVDLSVYPGLRAEETTEALSGILVNYEVAVAANGTSAAIDAYIAGLPVIVGLDGNSLNLSPLRGEVGAYFVSTPEELVEALMSAIGKNAASPNRENFFYLEKDLPRWKSLLQLSS
jgi:surface carbohydrate biosynthesis protein (TIGR04326 family)